MSYYNYLSGAITISRDAPNHWRDKNYFSVLDRSQCIGMGNSMPIIVPRIIHFWQFLTSGYLANLAGLEWKRLLHYEKTSEILPIADKERNHFNKNSLPFSANELVECWARNWDVHTRGPQRIVEEENIAVEDKSKMIIKTTRMLEASYSGLAFDEVMQHGPFCEKYANPYRWLLRKMLNSDFLRLEDKEYRTNVASTLSALYFPIITYFAMQTEQPVKVFCEAVEIACKNEEAIKRSDELIAHLDIKRNINFQWIWQYAEIHRDIVLPAIKRYGNDKCTTGFQVIEEGLLQNHPIFKEYTGEIVVYSIQQIFGRLNRENGYYTFLNPQTNEDRFRLSEYLNPKIFTGVEHLFPIVVDKADNYPMIVFGLPGQPTYRQVLGVYVPPPQIKFSNFTWHASTNTEFVVHGLERDKLEERNIQLNERIEGFLAAEEEYKQISS